MRTVSNPTIESWDVYYFIILSIIVNWAGDQFNTCPSTYTKIKAIKMIAF